MFGLNPLNNNLNNNLFNMFNMFSPPNSKFPPVFPPVFPPCNPRSGIKNPTCTDPQSIAAQKLIQIQQYAESSPEFCFNEGSYLSILSDSGVMTKEISEMIDKILINKTDMITEIINGISSLDVTALSESEIESKVQEYNNLLIRARAQLTEYRNILQQSVEKVKADANNGTVRNTDSIRNELVNNLSQISSISTKKSNDNNEVKSNIDLTKKVQSSTGELLKKYDVSRYQKKADNIEKALQNSKVPNISGVGSSIKTNIKLQVHEIQNMLGSVSENLQNCKSEEEVKAALSDIESELQQKKHVINVLVQRGEKAKELDKVLGKIYSDPAKAKLAEKINIDKITTKLTEQVEAIDVSDIHGNDNLSDEEKSNLVEEQFEAALKNDEISNVVDSLIKYVEKGEKDNILGDYLKDDQDEQTSVSQNAVQTNEQGTYNPFGLNKKNPYS